MATKTVNITKSFTLTHKDESGALLRTPFLPGIQEVDEALANHWYTQAHCAELPEAIKPKGDKKP